MIFKKDLYDPKEDSKTNTHGFRLFDILKTTMKDFVRLVSCSNHKMSNLLKLSDSIGEKLFWMISSRSELQPLAEKEYGFPTPYRTSFDGSYI